MSSAYGRKYFYPLLNRSVEIEFELDTTRDSFAVDIVRVEGDKRQTWMPLTIDIGVECGEACAFIDVVEHRWTIVEWLREQGVAFPTNRVAKGPYGNYPEVHFNLNRLKRKEVATICD